MVNWNDFSQFQPFDRRSSKSDPLEVRELYEAEQTSSEQSTDLRNTGCQSG